jgi:hypothetical protein
MADQAEVLEDVVKRRHFETLYKNDPGTSEKIANRVQMIAARLPRLLRTNSDLLAVARGDGGLYDLLPERPTTRAIVVENTDSLAGLGIHDEFGPEGTLEMKALVAFIDRSYPTENGIGVVLPLRDQPVDGQGFALLQFDRRGRTTVWRRTVMLKQRDLLDVMLHGGHPYEVVNNPPQDVTEEAFIHVSPVIIETTEQWLSRLIEHLDFLCSDLLGARRLAS